jgi:hypothetical protein
LKAVARSSECKNGEHQFFSGIHYIPKLKANIISVGQLDKAGFDVHIASGVCVYGTPMGVCSPRSRAGATGSMCSTAT